MWINGEPVLDYDNIMFRYDAKFKIDRLTFNNFHGGKASTFMPDHDQWVSYVPTVHIAWALQAHQRVRAL